MTATVPTILAKRPTTLLLLFLTGGCLALGGAVGSQDSGGRSGPTLEERTVHLAAVQRAEFCAGCHPEATAEHRQNTQGRAYTDPEVRLATARFSIPGCIDCHTPRPVFETGIGKNPIKRNHHLEEGDDCLSCHAKAGYDFSTFEGGAECKVAFDPRVGTVEACASCHRNHGTPYQWEAAEHGKKAGNTCVDCHMPEVERPVAVGMPAKKTRRHTFFASRSESQLAMAYEYNAKLEGNEVVVTLKNAGAGHNFPTELKQRSVESLVIIRDVAGREIARSRNVHRDPYKRPYGLVLPVNTQIPSGESREHRVPIPISAGTIETTLYYKLYYPIDDGHPTLSRTLASRSFTFGPIEPSTKPITTPPEVHANLPEALPVEAASPANLADFARPKIGKVDVDVPDGTHDGDIEKLIALFQFPAFEANRKAADVLVQLGAKAVPALVTGLGSWDSKTWQQSQQALIRIGAPAIPALVHAIGNEELYVRYHAREILGRFDKEALLKNGVKEALLAGLKAPHPLDRTTSAEACGKLGFREAIPGLRPMLQELDFDVVAASARALALLGDKESVPLLRKTLDRIQVVIETGRDVAWSLAVLGDAKGASFLLDKLDYDDDLVRESIFEAWLDVTGVSLGFTARQARDERLATLAELRNWWVHEGGEKALRHPHSHEARGALRAEIAKLVRDAGGNDIYPSEAQETERAIARLIEIGKVATPQIVEGLKWPPGFVDKRVALLRVLCKSPDPDALAALIDASNDPTMTTSLWAAQAMEFLGDPHALPSLRALTNRFDTIAAAGKLPGNIGHPEDTRVLLGRARMKLGDEEGARLLLRLLYSQEPSTRAGAEEALRGALADPKLSKAPWANDARIALEELPQKRAAQVAAMRATWQQLVEAAEQARDAATTREQVLAALVKYDFAEEAATRYATFDPRAFAVDFQRTAGGADDLSMRLYDDAAFRGSVAARDLLSPVERRGISVSATGLKATFETDGLVLEADAESGGFVNLGLGGAGGTAVPMEWWRDYELDFDLTIESKGLWVLDRYDPIWAIFVRTLYSPQAPEEASILHVPTAEGKTVSVQHIVCGPDVINLQGAKLATTGDGGAKSEELRVTAPKKVRKGGVVLQLDAGAKVVLRNLRLKVYRSDAAEAVNAQFATPGR